MAVLVDEARWPARGRLWAHLVSDASYEELHAFAAAAGIPRRGFDHDHYDVPAERVDALVAAGAQRVGGRELVRRLTAAGLRRGPRQRAAAAGTSGTERARAVDPGSGGPPVYPETVTAPASETAPAHDVSRRTEPARRVVLARVTDQVLDAAEHLRAVGDDAAGACVSFTGVVRDHDGGRSVGALRYVAHPGATAVVARVAGEVAAAHRVDALAVSHRLGDLVVGDVALVVAVSAAHRREAFEAAQALVEAVKAELPVWKEQVFTDGAREWVACP